MNYRYCYQCGRETERKTIAGQSRSYCRHCDLIFYENPKPSVAILALNNREQILLVKRNVAPGNGRWCLPGGFIEQGETAQEAVLRELKEETGLTGRNLRLWDAASYINGYYGDVLVLGYQVDLDNDQLQAGDDAAEADFFPVTELPSVVFDIHTQFIQQLITQLRRSETLRGNLPKSKSKS